MLYKYDYYWDLGSSYLYYLYYHLNYTDIKQHHCLNWIKNKAVSKYTAKNISIFKAELQVLCVSSKPCLTSRIMNSHMFLVGPCQQCSAIECAASIVRFEWSMANHLRDYVRFFCAVIIWSVFDVITGKFEIRRFHNNLANLYFYRDFVTFDFHITVNCKTETDLFVHAVRIRSWNLILTLCASRRLHQKLAFEHPSYYHFQQKNLVFLVCQ